jgi:hypothetical protein
MFDKLGRVVRRKQNALRRARENPDEVRLFVISRFPSISQSSIWLRWLYPAWWRYIFISWSMRFWRNHPTCGVCRNRFLLRVPNKAGIGDQIVTSWSEAYILAREFGLNFVHHPFVRSPHDPDTDWEKFLGFGVGETDAHQVLSDPALKTVWLPPLSLANQRNISIYRDIIERSYPEDNILFRLPRNMYFHASIDQSKIMPKIYAAKYEAARRQNPSKYMPDPSVLNVAVHIRRGDISSLKDKDFQQWERRWISDEYYLNALQDVIRTIGEVPFKVHIFSDGTEHELSAFSVVPHRIFHLREEPSVTFHALTSADILILSSSSFSICAGKICKGMKLIGRGFDRSDFKLFVPESLDWMQLEPTGHLSIPVKRRIREQLDNLELRRAE